MRPLIPVRPPWAAPWCIPRSCHPAAPPLSCEDAPFTVESARFASPLGAPMQTVLADRYVLEHEIARGAVGVVWRALDQVTGDHVAVKILRPELRDEEEIFESFRAEAD